MPLSGHYNAISSTNVKLMHEVHNAQPLTRIDLLKSIIGTLLETQQKQSSVRKQRLI